MGQFSVGVNRLDLPSADVRVIAERDAENSRYWSYLPTEQEAGFGVQVHADFYLSNSRKNLALRKLESNDAGNDPSGWNARLVELAADCIVELWLTPAVCEASNFWKFANPRECSCPYLRRAVALRLWKDDAKCFEQMVRNSFPNAETFPISRYRELFDATCAWADYAYRELDRGRLFDQHMLLLKHIQASGANVLPLTSMDPGSLKDTVECAKPLVIGEKGKPRGKDSDRIYWRNFNQGLAFDLPNAVSKQRSYVTTFSPGIPGLSILQQGLQDSSRPEILAQLQPGSDAREHEELVVAAIRLSSEESQGGLGSILDRAEELNVGAAWRFRIGETKPQETITQVGRSLSMLEVKVTSGGWKEGGKCGRVVGPWEQVDEHWLLDLINKHELKVDLEQACTVLGLMPIPLNEFGAPELPEELPVGTMNELLRTWDRLENFLRPEIGSSKPLRDALEQCHWLHSTDSLRIQNGVAGQSPYTPREVWLQSAKGFRTKLLPRIELEQPLMGTQWYRQLNICSPVELSTEARLRQALKSLRSVDPQEDMVSNIHRDLVELYGRLVESLTKQDIFLDIPLLYQLVGANGTLKSLGWGAVRMKFGTTMENLPPLSESLTIFVFGWFVGQQTSKDLG